MFKDQKALLVHWMAKINLSSYRNPLNYNKLIRIFRVLHWDFRQTIIFSSSNKKTGCMIFTQPVYSIMFSIFAVYLYVLFIKKVQ